MILRLIFLIMKTAIPDVYRLRVQYSHVTHFDVDFYAGFCILAGDII